MAISETDTEFRSSDGAVIVNKSTGGTHFSTDGKLAVSIVANARRDGTSRVSIYGDAQGLLALADLLTAFASLDQESVSDKNCPNGEGVHTSLTSSTGLASSSITLNLGRLDAKGTHDQNWFLQHDAVSIVPLENAE